MWLAVLYERIDNEDSQIVCNGPLYEDYDQAVIDCQKANELLERKRGNRRYWWLQTTTVVKKRG